MLLQLQILLQMALSVAPASSTTTPTDSVVVKADPYYCYEDGHLHRSRACRFFAAVIDAGSTGTRLQLYRFVHSTHEHGLPFHAEEETFLEVKPGLSSFVGRPSEAAASVATLLAKAAEIVPQDLRARTPIMLKATAGLRLLPGDAALRILSEVDTVVRASDFVCIGECVGVLDGSEEGVHSWFSLNLLLENFYHDAEGNEVDPSPYRSAAAFDLGGGSTQVTYWPRSDAVFSAHPKDRHDIDFFDSHMHLYTHSYPRHGLQAARLGVLQGAQAAKDTVELTSPCLPADFHLPSWEQALKTWSVRGTAAYSLQACAESVRDFVRRSKITPLKELRGSSQLYFFSYFYDRASQAGLVNGGKSNGNGVVHVGDILAAAEKACSRSGAELRDAAAPHWLAWQCLDLAYIHSLLKDGYGLADDQVIIPVSNIRGMGVSWALGMSYSLVDAFHRHLALDDVIDDDEDQRSATCAGTGDQRSSSEIKDQIAGSPAIEEADYLSVNATGVEIVDTLLTVISRKTTDVLQFFNIVS